MGAYVANEWLVGLLGDTGYAYGFTRQPLSETEVRERQLLINGCVGFDHLSRWARWKYPNDTNLALYAGRVLLRNSDYFDYMYPGFSSLQGRECDLEIVHIETGQERGKWLANGGDPDALLELDQWAIGIASLKNEYHKLYVHDSRHDGYNLCRDGFGHQHFAYRQVQLDRDLARAEATVGLELWHHQARVQGLNPCIFSVIRSWVLTLPNAY